MMNLKEMTHPACLPVVEDKQGQHGWQLLMFRIFDLRIQTQSDKHCNKNMNAAQRLKKWYITILLCFNLLCRLPKTMLSQLKCPNLCMLKRVYNWLINKQTADLQKI